MRAQQFLKKKNKNVQVVQMPTYINILYDAEMPLNSVTTLSFPKITPNPSLKRRCNDIYFFHFRLSVSLSRTREKKKYNGARNDRYLLPARVYALVRIQYL